MKKSVLTSLLAIALAGGAASAQNTPAAGRAGQPAGRPPTTAAPTEVPLWEHGAPGALGDAEGDRPTITIYRAARAATSTGVVVAPGGGYGALAMDHEGRQVAAYFNAMGVSAFVLKYRLGPRYRHPIELGDAQRAVRLVRHRAQELGV
ncbi:MAG: alpha/beta hydrolase, partial [Vicinamibacterales bacterium]